MTSPRLLDRYRIDRAHGLTASGAEQLVILVLKPNDGPEISYAMSRADAMLISLQMQRAATEAQTDS